MQGERFKMPCCYRGKTWHAEWETRLDKKWGRGEGGGNGNKQERPQKEKDAIRLWHRHKCAGREHDCDQSYFRILSSEK